MERACNHKLFAHPYLPAFDFPDDQPVDSVHDRQFRRPLPSPKKGKSNALSRIEVDAVAGEGSSSVYKDTEMTLSTPLREGKGKGRQLAPGSDVEMSPAKRVRKH